MLFFSALQLPQGPEQQERPRSAVPMCPVAGYSLLIPFHHPGCSTQVSSGTENL